MTDPVTFTPGLQRGERKNTRRAGGILDAAITGLDGTAVDDLHKYAEIDAETAVEMPEHPVVRPGDVWVLGNHRIACGDSTDAGMVNAALGAGRAPILMVTDPPYGVDYDPNWRNLAMRTDGTPFGGRAVGTVSNDSRADWRDAWALFPGDVAYVWHADRHAKSVQESLEAAKFEIRNQIIWAKNRFVIGRGNYHWQHEPCWYAIKSGSTSNWHGDRSQTTLWFIEHRKSETGHSTQKPIECMRRPIINNTAPSDVVYDPFLGSGTTLIAAEMTKRQCRGVELNPIYVYISITRWQTMTGQLAVLENSGENFTEVFLRRRDEPQKVEAIVAAASGAPLAPVPMVFTPRRRTKCRYAKP